MASGVPALPCRHRSVFAQALCTEGSSIPIGKKFVVRGKGVRLSGAAFGFRRRRSPGTGCSRRRRVNCAFGGGGSDTESCTNVQLPVLTLYELLEIGQEVGLSEIKTAYRQLARRYHPDVCPPSARDECTKKFLQVQEAYEILADPDLRADYDFRLRNPLSVQALTSGLTYNRKWGQRRGSAHEDFSAREGWRSQWESQVDSLRTSRRRKPDSWAERMRKQHEEKKASVEDFA